MGLVAQGGVAIRWHQSIPVAGSQGDNKSRLIALLMESTTDAG
jgi:hypothetical protein